MKRFLPFVVLFLFETALLAQPSSGPYPVPGGGGGSASNISGGTFSNVTLISPIFNGITEIDGTLISTTNIIAPIIGGRIYIFTNDIDGLNTAKSLLAVSADKMNAGGGAFVFQHGIHYITQAFFYSNATPASITFEGEGMPGVSIVYTGPNTNVNIFRFMGTHANDGVLLQVHLKDITFSSIYDTTNWLVQIQEAGWINIEGCQFVPWVIATNNLNRGIAVSEDDVTSRSTNMGGLYLGPTDTGAGVTISRCYFKWLQNGLYDETDHMLGIDNYYSLIGQLLGAQTTGWPTNSIFRLGAAIIRGAGVIAQTVHFFNHFTRDNIIILDSNTAANAVNKAMLVSRGEGCRYRYVALNTVTKGFRFESFYTEAGSSLDATYSIQGVTNAISTATKPPVMLPGQDSGTDPTGLTMFTSATKGFRVDTNGDSIETGSSSTYGTNISTMFSQLPNYEGSFFSVTGGNASENGTYVWKYTDRVSTRAPFTTVWTNTVGTNLIKFFHSSDVAPWGLLSGTNGISDDDFLYFNLDFSTDPPASTWDQDHGSAASVNAVLTYGKFEVRADGSMNATLITNTGTSYIPTNTASFTIITNEIIYGRIYTNGNQRSHIECEILLTGGVTSLSIASLWLDQNQDGTFEQKGVQVENDVGTATALRMRLGAFLQPNAAFVYTNLSTGTASSAILTNGTQWTFQ